MVHEKRALRAQRLAYMEEMPVYKKSDPQKKLPFDLFLCGKLDPTNRWIRLGHLIPWNELEEVSEYTKNFRKSGKVAKNFRIAFGALLIQAKLKLTDEETCQQVSENPYLQYFLGLEVYQSHAPFSPSLMVHFRKRLPGETMNRLNLKILELQKKNEDSHNPESPEGNPPEEEAPPKDSDNEAASSESSPSGTLVLDATCTPADIAYPTDLRLLNHARECLENLIDRICERSEGLLSKPRMHRKKARREYLKAAKKRRIRGPLLRKALRKQLGYLRRNLKFIADMLEQFPERKLLSEKEESRLRILETLYRQQLEMYRNRNHRTEHRIVSIAQPHVRPIVRGKARTDTEFGAKLALSIDNGYSLVELLSWENFNEGLTLAQAAENYRNRHGHYPEVICADAIYRNRANLAYCRERGIRLSGPPLGRPPVDPEENRERKRITRQDAATRNSVEGKFGEAKRAYNLGCIRGKRKDTSETLIVLQFITMNLWSMLRDFLRPRLILFQSILRRFFLIFQGSLIHNVAFAA